MSQKTGYIYKLFVNDFAYYGSTSQNIDTRYKQHQSAYTRFVSGKIVNYCSSFDVFKEGCPLIDLIETVTYNDKTELKHRERFYIENNNCVNINKPGRTNEEGVKHCWIVNKDKYLLQQQKYWMKRIKKEIEEEKMKNPEKSI